jgi:hypothetical protein
MTSKGEQAKSDILPGLGGDVAGGGVLAILAKLGDSGRDKLTFWLERRPVSRLRPVDRRFYR